MVQGMLINRSIDLESYAICRYPKRGDECRFFFDYLYLGNGNVFKMQSRCYTKGNNLGNPSVVSPFQTFCNMIPLGVTPRKTCM